MKKLLLASVLTALTLTAAQAADAIIYEPAPSPTSHVPVYDWSGAYLGAQVGYAWGKSDYTPGSGLVVAPFTYSPNGLIGGIYAGYNNQFMNNWVLGVDADINATGADAGVAVSPGSHFASSEINYTAALRARLGYAVDRWMPYIAGGLSVAKYKFDLDHDGTGNWDFQDKKTFTGWNIGAGIEYAATDNIIARAEYRFSDFGNWKYDNNWGTGNTVDLKTHDIRFGIAYKF